MILLLVTSYSSTARFYENRVLFHKFRAKFAEIPHASRDREEFKNAKLAGSSAVERNWLFPTAHVGHEVPGPSGKFSYKALALKYGLVIFHDSTQRDTNPPQNTERSE